MIPTNITRPHVLRAIAHIDRHGVEPGREATRYELVHEERTYPPKYVVSLANLYANGDMLPAPSFSGGMETNHFLERRGFVVRAFGEAGKKAG